MKILVIQLARLGDIYQTWPSLNALRRKYPSAKIDLLVRSRFSSAANGSNSVDSVISLNTSEILRPVVESDDTESSLHKINDFTMSLAEENYDYIFNFSFSPFSSYLVDVISSSHTYVKGYSRFFDGYLSVGDDTAAYFHGQVGIEKNNRAHITEVFAALAEVELEPEDFKCHEAFLERLDELKEWNEFGIAKGNYAVLHVGASQAIKTFEAFKWRQVLKNLNSIDVILVGSKEEKDKASQILDGTSFPNVINAVGMTNIEQLFSLIKGSRIAIGGDSVVMAMASLCDKPCLNISFPSVNFWETGPFSSSSRIVFANHPEELPSDKVAKECINLFNSNPAGEDVITAKASGFVKYESPQDEPFEWKLIKAIYMQDPFPVVDSEVTFQGLQNIYELTQIALQQIDAIKRDPNNHTAAGILNQVDALLDQVKKQVTELQPLLDWFVTEKTRIGPGSLDSIISQTERKFLDLQQVLGVYLPTSNPLDKENVNELR